MGLEKTITLHNAKYVMGRYIATLTRWSKFAEPMVAQILASLLTPHPTKPIRQIEEIW